MMDGDPIKILTRYYWIIVYNCCKSRDLRFHFGVFVNENRKCKSNITTKPKGLVYNFLI